MTNLDSMLQQCASLDSAFDPPKWDLYWKVISQAQDRKIPFALGGGLAAAIYSGQLRECRDIDLYIQPEDRERMIALVTELGLADYCGQKPYDRRWIYRSFLGDMIVDIMWAMANQRSQVDAEWLNGPVIQLKDRSVRIVPPEETLWSKLYVLQRDRCDWPDALNILHAVGPEMDWQRLLGRIGPDSVLLGGLLSTFRWLCPQCACALPSWLWRCLKLEPPVADCPAAAVSERAALLDSRPWFTPAV